MWGGGRVRGGFEWKTRPLPLVLTCDRLDFNEATWTPCDVLWRKAKRRAEEGGVRKERGEGGSFARFEGSPCCSYTGDPGLPVPSLLAARLSPTASQASSNVLFTSLAASHSS